MSGNADAPEAQAKGIAVDYDPFADGELLLTAPPTEAQREIWLSVQMGSSASCAYNESMNLLLHGDLDIEALKSAVQQLIQRHEALRITFSPEGDTFSIAKTLHLEIPLLDLSDFEAAERDARLDHICRQEVREPFDLVHGPLFRVQIVKLQDGEFWVLLTSHHIICDGWSLGVLISDLGAL
jgi:NRPS condensation-like uncharacterized protein